MKLQKKQSEGIVGIVWGCGGKFGRFGKVAQALTKIFLLWIGLSVIFDILKLGQLSLFITPR
jgi:hypothetical protein